MAPSPATVTTSATGGATWGTTGATSVGYRGGPGPTCGPWALVRPALLQRVCQRLAGKAVLQLEAGGPQVSSSGPKGHAVQGQLVREQVVPSQAATTTQAESTPKTAEATTP